MLYDIKKVSPIKSALVYLFTENPTLDGVYLRQMLPDTYTICNEEFFESESKSYLVPIENVIYWGFM